MDKKISLESLLASRDERVRRQEEILGLFPGKTLICMTVILPGEVKRNSMSLKIAAAAEEALGKVFTPVFKESRDLDTGYECYLVVDIPATEAKQLCCDIEDGHPLGRMMDIDVVVPWGGEERAEGAEGGGAARPLSRREACRAQRLCLLCGRPARECIRTRRHSPEALLRRISELIYRNI